MHDAISVTKLSDTQLQDLVQSIDRKMGGISPSNPYAFEIMMGQKDVIISEMQERQLSQQFRNQIIKPINLTDDDLSKQEDNESKDRE